MQPRTWPRFLLRIALTCITISAVSALYFSVVPANSATIHLTFLLLVLGAAALWGLPEAIFASIWSMVCLNYHFLPPLYSMQIDDPQNWVAWGAFLITSLVASDLSTRSKKRAIEAMRRQREIERMYALSCSLMLGDSAAGVAARIPEQVASLFGCTGVSFYDRGSGQIFRAGNTSRIDDAALVGTAGTSELVRHPDDHVTIVSMNLGANTIGSLGFSGDSISAPSMQSIANLAAMAMDRVHKQDIAGQAEGARRHQELKSMLLDALAHEFQTPLTSIRAAVSAMLAESPDPEQKEWLEIMEEESARLSSMMVETIQMARLEAGHVDLDKQTHTIEDLVYSAMESDIAEPERVTVEVPPGLQPVSVDAGLIRLVIRQIVGNALKYSDPGTSVEIRARADEDSVVVGISNSGPGISAEDQKRIFDKYYRGQQGRGHVTGMGMGLPIARQVIEAHEGRIWVESQPGKGARFYFSLPFAHEEASV
ncbi:MAG: ATP-binding protein [Bryobacteraceae bacterium]